MKTKILCTLGILLLVLGLVGCDSGEVVVETQELYSVAYYSEFGKAPAAKNVSLGTVLKSDFLKPLSADGYIFDGWYEGDTKILPDKYTVVKSIILVAKWKSKAESAEVNYTVEHYKENIENNEYTKVYTEPLRGIANTSTKANPITELNLGKFKPKFFNQETIKADGSTIVKIYYDRPYITFNFDLTGGNGTLTKISGKYEADVPEIKEPVKENSIFKKWNKDIPSKFMENMDFTAVWDSDVSYKVEHYIQNIENDEYSLALTEELHGLANSYTKAEPSKNSKFENLSPKYFAQKEINSDGTTVVQINYDRPLITLTFDLDGGSGISNTITGKYGAYLPGIDNPVKENSEFLRWEPKLPATYSKNSSFKAIWDVGVNYKVEHYKQNIEDDKYTLILTEELTGIGNAKTEAKPSSCEDFVNLLPQFFNQEKINSDGSTVVKIYYDRPYITFTFNLDGGKGVPGKISGKYETSVPKVDNPVKDNSVFKKWNREIPVSFTENMDFTAIWDTDTAYTVKHWKQNAENNEYSLDFEEKMYGSPNTLTKAIAKNFNHFTLRDEVEQKSINSNGSTVIDIYYNRDTITFTFDLNGGNSFSKTITGKYQSPVEITDIPVKENSEFLRWEPALPSSFKSNMNFKAIWSTNANYKVKYYQENANDNGFTLVETLELSGKSGDTTKAEEKSYPNFVCTGLNQSVIKEDNSTEVSVFYKRNQYKFTFNLDGGSGIPLEITGKFGQIVPEIKEPAKSNAYFTGWDQPIPSTFTANFNFTAKWDVLAEYKVKHFQQNPDDDGYTLVDTDILSGKIEESTKAMAKTYENFTKQNFVQQVIKADGSTVVEIKYNRNKIRFTFNLNGGEGATTIDGKYGQKVNIKTPVKPDYKFTSWTPNLPETFISNGTFSANWENAVSYTVEHYQQNANDDSYTLFESETLSGFKGEPTEALAKEYAHFNPKTFNQVPIQPNGVTVVKVYYDREQITLTFNSNGGNGGDSAITGKYGQNLPEVINPAKPGYVFGSWAPELPAVFTENKTLTAQWTKSNFTVEVGNSDIEIKVSRNYSQVTLTVPAEYTCVWYDEDLNLVKSGNTYTFDTYGWNAGTYTFAAFGTKDGIEYSNTVTIRVEL